MVTLESIDEGVSSELLITSAPVTIAYSGGGGGSSLYNLPVDFATGYVATPAGATVMVSGTAYNSSGASQAFTSPVKVLDGVLQLAVLPQLVGGQPVANVVVNKVNDNSFPAFQFKPTAGGGVPQEDVRYLLSLIIEKAGLKEAVMALNFQAPFSMSTAAPVSQTPMIFIGFFALLTGLLGVLGLGGSKLLVGLPLLSNFLYKPLALTSLGISFTLILVVLAGWFS